jgi:diguanylate cyclase (GGDEF)-like protein
MTQGPISSTLFDSVYKIASSLTSSLKEEEVLNNIMALVGEIFQPDNWSLFSYLEDEHKLEFKIVVGKESEHLIGKSFSADSGIAGLCMKSRKPVIIPDASKDERILDLGIEEVKTKSIIAVPMYSNDIPLGVIELINADEACFLPEKIKLLETLADFASISMQNSLYLKTIEKKATIDDCTDLYNARFMYTVLNKEISRFRRNSTQFGLVFFDLDHFKSVNDNYGHLIGSQLLREVAGVIKECIRPTDWGIRYGGDEFVVILQSAGYRETMTVTERIREKLNSRVFFEDEGFNIKVPASFGLAIFPEDGGDIEGIIKAADNAMYEAKKSGRNRICHCA